MVEMRNPRAPKNAKKSEKKSDSAQKVQAKKLLDIYKDLPTALPKSPFLLQDIIRALLVQIYNNHHGTGIQLERCTHLLAALEKQFLAKNDPAMFRLLYETRVLKQFTNLIKGIAKEKVTSKKHLPFVLKIQYLALDEHFSDRSNKGFPYKARNPASKSLWLKERGIEILPFVTAIRCLHPCEYASSFQNISERFVRSITTKRTLIYAILAHLHHTTPQQIHKLLKPASFK